MVSSLKKMTVTIAAGVLAFSSVSMAQPSSHASGWISGDFHQHSLYSDGSTPIDFVMSRNNMYGLSWWANSEHGGQRTYDGNGIYWDDQTVYPAGTILGDYRTSGGHQLMYRWQSLRDFAWPDIVRTRSIYSNKNIVSGVEWNVPGHEHCSVGIIGQDATAVSAFEFQFDKSDNDMSRVGEVTPYGTLVKANGTTNGSSRKPNGLDRHADALAACTWMKAQKDAGRIDDAWIVWAHIERAGAFRTGSSDGGYNVENFRDFNNAAPEICFGFEGIPGHQQNMGGRGGFGTSASGGGTYGGAGYYSAQVGGLWDALLGEGRRWFNFASSDYHLHWTKGGDDYFPGEYQKTWSFAEDLNDNQKLDLQEIGASLRSGNVYTTMGDLVNKLRCEAAIMNNGRAQSSVEMGGELVSQGPINELRIRVLFRSPKYNNYADVPKVDHIDLIAGDITGKIDPTDPNYTNATNPSARVVARFTSADWTTQSDGSKLMTYTLRNVDKSMYFRVRGTNMAPGTAGQTDADGNPLLDTPAATPTIETGNTEAWKDLWVYGNPMFVYVR